MYSNFCKKAELKNLEKLRIIMLKIAQIVNFAKIKLDVASVHEMCPNLHIILHIKSFLKQHISSIVN